MVMDKKRPFAVAAQDNHRERLKSQAMTDYFCQVRFL
jgi:hypothetical protein